MTRNPKHDFQISTSSGVPIYRQVIDQVKTLIATGRFGVGEFLPSVRHVSKELEINPMTVSKAYSLLEVEGVLELVRGQGMRVRNSPLPKASLAQRQETIKPLLREVVTRTRQLSLKPKNVMDILDDLWKER